MTTVLQSTTCVVRSFRTSDAASLARHGNNRAVWLNLRDRFPHPYAEKDAAWYIDFVLTKNPYHSLAIEVDGEAVGGVSLRPGEDIERIGAEIGYWLGEAHWGRGVMTDVVRMTTDYAFTELGLERVFAVPFTTNVASCRVLEKAGYVREGTLRRSAIKDGRILDQFIYAKVRLAP
jgi:RimJ/RimL family protein N-acetyltransferase